MRISSLLKTVAIAGGLSAVAFSPAAFADVKLMGSGASFPAPIYAKWFKDFSAANKGVRVDYQSKGSGAGIQDFVNQVVDF
uniref:substrate-binding domain-containing protein n=1 Tax=Thiocapsa sp. TaxID=2024551 RepID=UPI0025E9CAA2